jgi:hypothetical protein
MTEGTEQKDVDYSTLIRAQTRQVDIEAFKERGMQRVNVINARKINELISQAVTNIIGRMEDADIQTIKDDKAQIVMDSMAEFKRLFSETKKEHEGQSKLQEEIELLREALAKGGSTAPDSASTLQVEGITDAITELKAFLVNQASKAQSQEMTRAAMLEQQAQLLDDHFNELKAQLAAGTVASAPPAQEDSSREAFEHAVNKIMQLLEQQNKTRNGTSTETLLKAFTELRDDLNQRFGELTGVIKESGKSAGAADQEALKKELGALRDDLKQATATELKAELSGLRKLLEREPDHSAERSVLKEELGALREELKHASTSELKAEIAALRADLEEKTVAASAAGSAALQAQLTQMQEMLAKGGGGPSGDLGDIVSKLEGSLSKKLAEAGIGKQEVSADDALAASGVMLGAAFRDMDNVESNIGSLDAKKTVDKSGAKKAKGALEALKKLKGKG